MKMHGISSRPGVNWSEGSIAHLRRSQLAIGAILLALNAAVAAPAAAQHLGGLAQLVARPATSGDPTQVISVNPFGMVLQFYNAEYEVRVSDAVTAGAGASRRGWYVFGEDESPRLNGDIFVRYYPWGQAFNGVSLGLKAGATRLPHEGTFAGIGFDLNHSAALTDHVVLSSGLGLKRLVGRHRDVYSDPVIATLRLNVGIGF